MFKNAIDQSPKFLSTPSARRATFTSTASPVGNGYFYPRPPRGGRRDMAEAVNIQQAFLSTPSARRATRLDDGKAYGRRYFYPRPPRGGRPIAFDTFRQFPVISIHALREEGDGSVPFRSCKRQISIHALREEDDPVQDGAYRRCGDFYPRPP